MKTRIAFTLCLISLISCMKDDNTLSVKSQPQSQSYKQQYDSAMRAKMVCDENSLNMDEGTRCCVSGFAQANPGESLTYEYRSKYRYPSVGTPVVNWVILEGSITIISGQGTPTAIFKFGTDFTTGKISATGTGVERLPTGPATPSIDTEVICEEQFTITTLGNN